MLLSARIQEAASRGTQSSSSFLPSTSIPMQTFSETFGDKLVLLLIDKLAIGLLLLGIAFLLNRILERFKWKPTSSPSMKK